MLWLLLFLTLSVGSACVAHAVLRSFFLAVVSSALIPAVVYLAFASPHDKWRGVAAFWMTIYGTVISIGIGIVFSLCRWSRRRRAIPPGHCQKCGYNLTGNTSGVCPECGIGVLGVESGSKPMACAQCGYDLTGNTSAICNTLGICPECGSQV